MPFHKQVGNHNFTEPDLPDRMIIEEQGVRIQHYYRSGDHAPPHLHVTDGGSAELNETRIGQNGHPLRNNPALTAVQLQIVSSYRRPIRNAVGKIGRRSWFNSL